MSQWKDDQMPGIVQAVSAEITRRVEPARPPDSTDMAVLHTVIYADVFDYPLTAAEIHRYLISVPASFAAVSESLHTLQARGDLQQERGLFCLPGRAQTIAIRARKAEAALRLQEKAIYYGRLIAGLPFVRMVAVTGALAMANAEAGDDIDYLIVTEPGRLWLCRAFVVAQVRLAARRGDTLCPNYFLSRRALALPEQNLYTAHELAQMIPVAGIDQYCEMRRLNPWTSHFLPNAGYALSANSASAFVEPARSAAQSAAETMLRTPPGALLERWEMERKIRKLSHRQGEQAEISFGADWCKGHFGGHAGHTLATYAARVERITGGAASLEVGG